MRKNRTMRVAALLLALTLITSCFVGGTMAKYTSASDAEATAEAAAWFTALDFTAGDAAHTYTNVTAKKLAPGTTGTITLTAPTASGTPEVAWTLELSGTATATTGKTAPDNLTFDVSFGGTAVKENLTLTELNTALSAADGILLKTGTAGTDTLENIVITWDWEWKDEAAANTADTAFADATITFDLALTAEQVQPTAATN